MTRGRKCLLLAAGGALLLGLLCFLLLDREPPEIYWFTEEETVCADDKTDLLSGVRAADGRDGDVSETLTVDSVTPASDGTHVLVRYTARDKSGNLAHLTRDIPTEKEPCPEG